MVEAGCTHLVEVGHQHEVPIEGLTDGCRVDEVRGNRAVHAHLPPTPKDLQPGVARLGHHQVVAVQEAQVRRLPQLSRQPTLLVQHPAQLVPANNNDNKILVRESQ